MNQPNRVKKPMMDTIRMGICLFQSIHYLAANRSIIFILIIPMSKPNLNRTPTNIRPMITNAINQLVLMTEWGELDYLIVDLPPGTSDGPLTVLQTLNLDGFVIVTAPQDISKLDAIRSINMIKKLNQKVLGIIENFSGTIFGSGAGKEISEKFNIPMMGTLSLNADYGKGNKPTVLTNTTVKEEYNKIIEQLSKELIN